MWKIAALALALAGCRSKHTAAADQIRVAPPEAKQHVAGRTTISGHVLDAADQSHVPTVKVVLENQAGELVAVTNGDGAYELTVPPGRYRMFVRDDRVMSVGVPDRIRIDRVPRAELANHVDESLAPVLVVGDDDTTEVDLDVVRIARLAGRVIDFDGKAVSHAFVRATSAGLRPVLGTDLSETNDTGEYELRLPEGRFDVDVGHPKYATSTQRTVSVLHAAFPTKTTLELDPGCVISGRVVGPNGPANDGAIERENASIERFGPASRIEADGTFRFTTLEEAPVTLRAWPWRASPSQPKVFACKSGARFADVRFAVTDATPAPAMSGTITDANGAPVPFAFVDVKPLAQTELGQQERGDAAGNWGVFDARPGQYEITSSAPGRGIVVAQVTAPNRDVHLVLNGTGRIAGTTTPLVDGVIAVSFTSCSDAFDAQKHPMQIAHDPRLVPVRGGRFVIDDVPACQLAFTVRWHGVETDTGIDVATGKTSTIELVLGTPRNKSVTGIVRDAENNAVVHARVTATLGGKDLESTYTDDEGHYALHALAGSEVAAHEGLRAATATVGRAAVDAEQIDFVLADP